MPVKSISLIVREDPLLLQDKIFSGDALYGMKSDNYPFVAIKEKLNKQGIEIHTHDILHPKNAGAILCLDQVLLLKSMNVSNKPSYLIISEPPVYCPENWDPKYHESYTKIFTYDSRFCTNERYVHYRFPIEFQSHPPLKKITETEFNRRKLASIIAGSFQIAKPDHNTLSLLHERYLVIKWFAENHPQDLDVYGRNLEGKIFTDFKGAGLLKKLKLQSLINRIGKYYSAPFNSLFKGSIPPLEKIKYQQDYNFSLCYENSKNIYGCISERIFDSFAASSIPVYLGAPDINKWIPSNSYIDKSHFKSCKELYLYIKNMSFTEYTGYLNAAKDFLNNPGTALFNTDSYSNIIISNIAHA